MSLPLSGAPHGTEPLSILLSTLWSVVMQVVCFVLSGLHTEGLPRGIFPASRWLGSGERSSWKCRGSRLDAMGQLRSSLQEKSLQQDMGTVPLLLWIWPWGESPEALSHPRCSRPPAGGRDARLLSSLRNCRSFKAGALELIWDEERGFFPHLLIACGLLTWGISGAASR